MDQDRKAAFDVLLKIEKNNAYSNIELNNISHDKSIVNMSFVREIVYGVTTNRDLIDYSIGQLAAKGIASVDIKILILLRMGIYQIVYMDSVPEFAAVNETVDLAKKISKHAASFVNGVLRNFIRKKDDLKKAEDIRDPRKRMHVMYSADYWIIDCLSKSYGHETTERILEASNSKPELFAVVNELKVTPDELIEKLVRSGVKAERFDKCESVIKLSGANALDNDSFRNGEFFIQDASSTIAVKNLDVRPGDLLIDVCAAPGGKSFSAAMSMKNQGRIKAFDIYDNKLKVVARQAKKLGIEILDIAKHDSESICEEYRGSCDRVICDVPCTGLGVLRRKPEIKYRDVENIDKLIEKQKHILDASLGYLRQDGMLMYSTCTVNKAENENVVRDVLDNKPGYSIVTEDQKFPGESGMDGFYHCIIKRD